MNVVRRFKALIEVGGCCQNVPCFQQRCFANFTQTTTEPGTKKDALKRADFCEPEQGAPKPENPMKKQNKLVKKWLRKAVETKKQKNHQEAIDLLFKAISVEEGGRNKIDMLNDLWKHVAWSYYDLGQYEDALNAANKAFELGSLNAGTAFVLGKTHAAMGNEPEAETYFKIALELDKNRHRVKQILDDLQL